jgi:DNA adenine methylase
MSMHPIKPCSPVAPWIGGKSRLAPFLAEIISRTQHTTYAEPFVGMGGVFFKREFAPKSEVINDYSRDVSNLFRILQRHYVQFMDTLKWQLHSRAEFERLLAANPETLTDLERAARFLYLQKTSFGGKVTGQNFGTVRGGPARFDLTKLTSVLEDAHTRLAGVVIERMDYKDFIRHYDREDTLFYLDPPYYGCEGDYGKELFNRNEFMAMAELLKGLKGRFLLSLNDTPEVRSIFTGFEFLDVRTAYSLAGGDKQKTAAEVVIANYTNHSLF